MEDREQLRDRLKSGAQCFDDTELGFVGEDCREILRWIAELESELFAHRQAASGACRECGEVDAMRRVSTKTLSEWVDNTGLFGGGAELTEGVIAAARELLDYRQTVDAFAADCALPPHWIIKAALAHFMSMEDEEVAVLLCEFGERMEERAQAGDRVEVSVYRFVHTGSAPADAPTLDVQIAWIPGRVTKGPVLGAFEVTTSDPDTGKPLIVDGMLLDDEGQTWRRVAE